MTRIMTRSTRANRNAKTRGAAKTKGRVKVSKIRSSDLRRTLTKENLHEVSKLSPRRENGTSTKQLSQITLYDDLLGQLGRKTLTKQLPNTD